MRDDATSRDVIVLGDGRIAERLVDVAARLGLSTRQVQRRVDAGEIIKTTKPGKKVPYYYEANIEERSVVARRRDVGELADFVEGYVRGLEARIAELEQWRTEQLAQGTTKPTAIIEETSHDVVTSDAPRVPWWRRLLGLGVM